MATRIVELDRGKLMSCPGSFAEYQRRKAQMLHDEAIVNAKFDKVLAQEEVWIRKGWKPGARATKAACCVSNNCGATVRRASGRAKVELAVDAGEKSGQLVAELQQVKRHSATVRSERPWSATFVPADARGDKVGLIGPNGASKTTLLRMILGELAPG